MRTTRHVIAALAIGALAVAASGCGDEQMRAGSGGGHDPADRTTQMVGTIGDGGTLRDGNLTFSVPKLTTGNTIRTTVDPIKAAAGEKLVDVTVRVTNDGRASLQPFCVNPPIVLVDSQSRNYKPESDSMYMGDNCATVPPGGSRDFRYAFRVTKGAQGFGVGLWDSDEPGDFQGDTYVYFGQPK